MNNFSFSYPSLLYDFCHMVLFGILEAPSSPNDLNVWKTAAWTFCYYIEKGKPQVLFYRLSKCNSRDFCHCKHLAHRELAGDSLAWRDKFYTACAAHIRFSTKACLLCILKHEVGANGLIYCTSVNLRSTALTHPSWEECHWWNPPREWCPRLMLRPGCCWRDTRRSRRPPW